MIYSYTTYSKQGEYYTIVFENDFDPDNNLIVKFLPKVPLPFSKDNIDLQAIKLRDPEVILYMLEQCGLTMIMKGV